MKNLIIVRHGNTFLAGETPLRVGCRTDLPLVEEARSRRAGRYLKERGFLPDRVVAAPLKRTMETARLLVKTMELPLDVETATIFSEIDYGPDEGKSEEEIMLLSRTGRRPLRRRCDGGSRARQTGDRTMECRRRSAAGMDRGCFRNHPQLGRFRECDPGRQNGSRRFLQRHHPLRPEDIGR